MATMTWGNPYTHEEHSRDCIPNAVKVKITGGIRLTSQGYIVRSCDWCGQEPARLYRYDGDRHLFCNRQCFNDYHS